MVGLWGCVVQKCCWYIDVIIMLVMKNRISNDVVIDIYVLFLNNFSIVCCELLVMKVMKYFVEWVNVVVFSILVSVVNIYDSCVLLL